MDSNSAAPAVHDSTSHISTNAVTSDPSLLPANAANGMMTNVWGPPGWVFLHAVTFGYPVDPVVFDKEHGLDPGTTEKRYRNFFEHVGLILPCRYCRESYQQFAKEVPIRANNRDELTRWLYDIHCKVNAKLGKPNASFDDIRKRYEGYRATCSKDKKGCSVPVGLSTKQQSCVLVYSDLSMGVILFALVAICVILFASTQHH